MKNLKTINKKRLSIMVEVPYLKRLLRRLDKIEVPGYTVLTGIAGSGRSSNWRADALSSDTGQMVQVLMLLDASEIEPILTEVQKILKKQIGIISFSDEEVLDPDSFK